MVNPRTYEHKIWHQKTRKVQKYVDTLNCLGLDDDCVRRTDRVAFSLRSIDLSASYIRIITATIYDRSKTAPGGCRAEFYPGSGH